MEFNFLVCLKKNSDLLKNLLSSEYPLILTYKKKNRVNPVPDKNELSNFKLNSPYNNIVWNSDVCNYHIFRIENASPYI